MEGFSGIYKSKFSLDKIVMYFRNNKVYIIRSSEPISNIEKLFFRDENYNKFYYSPSYGSLEN